MLKTIEEGKWGTTFKKISQKKINLMCCGCACVSKK